MKRSHHRLFIHLACAVALAGCLDDTSVPVGPEPEPEPATLGGVVIEVGALNLDDVTSALYAVSVRNVHGQTITALTIDSAVYGNGQGSATYVAPCDADPDSQPNQVTATLVQLFSGNTPVSVVMPPPAVELVDCLPDQDVLVEVDFTVVRSANQGFFDIKATVDEIFCSAKLDCVDDFTPSSVTTVIIGFACAAGHPDEVDTRLFMSDVVIDCGGEGYAVSINPTGDGHLPLANLAGDTTLITGARAYRGGQGYSTADAKYWNLSFGLTSWASVMNCRVRAYATAADRSAAQGPFETPPYAFPDRYPIVSWDVSLALGGEVLCTSHPVGGGNGVDVVFPEGGMDLPHAYGAAQ